MWFDASRIESFTTVVTLTSGYSEILSSHNGMNKMLVTSMNTTMKCDRLELKGAERFPAGSGHRGDNVRKALPIFKPTSFFSTYTFHSLMPPRQSPHHRRAMSRDSRDSPLPARSNANAPDNGHNQRLREVCGFQPNTCDCSREADSSIMLIL